MIDVALADNGHGLEAAMGMLGKPWDDVAVIHAPAVRVAEVLSDVVAGKRCRRAELIVALRIAIEMMDAEQKRIERLPPIAQRADLKDGIGHPVTLQYARVWRFVEGVMRNQESAKAFMVAAFVASATLIVGAQQRSHDVAAEVLAFERDVEAAVVRGDVPFVDAATAPTFTFTHGDGWTTGGAPLRVDTRADWMATVAKAPYASRVLDSVKTEVHGDVVITYGRYVGRFKDAAPGRRTFTVWSSASTPDGMASGNTCPIAPWTDRSTRRTERPTVAIGWSATVARGSS
jgi:uncharacterized protein DUF4440